MKNFKLVGFLCLCLINCKENDDFPDGVSGEPPSFNCSDVIFPDWSTSDYVLPFPIGKSYQIGLSACTNSYHAPGQPDQFAIDINMPIDSQITSSTNGQVIYVEESGNDFEFPNNIIVVKYGNVFIQYMHLTKDGALVEVGDTITKGQLIGYSGATGLAGYPHLHFVVTTDSGWEYPYDSVPVTFKNTAANPNSLVSGETYTATNY
jgi:Peptidase family M23